MRSGTYYRGDRKQWFLTINYRHPDGSRTQIRRRAQVNSRVGAEAERAQLLLAIAAGTYGSRESRTFAELVTEFREHAQHTVKASTLAFYNLQLDVHLLPVFGQLPCDKIVGPNLDAFIDTHRGGGRRGARKVATVNTALRTLRRVLRFGHERGYLRDAPRVTQVKNTDPKTLRFLTFEEADRLIAAAEPHGQWHAFVLLGLRAGLRVGEILSLRWEDLDFEASKVHVRRSTYDGVVTTPKSGHAREVPLTKQTAVALKAIRHLRGPLVFCHKQGEPFTRDGVRSPLARICRDAGLEELGPHSLRHSFASHCVIRGYHIREVQEFLGHSSVTVTERYSHLAPAAGNRLDALDGKAVQ